MDTLITSPILEDNTKNKSSPIQFDVSTIISTGCPYCQYKSAPSSRHFCSNRSVPGSDYCGPHGGKLTLRSDGTIGIVGPGTYRAIASLAGLNHRYVSQVLQGNGNPTQKVLDKIAQVVGVDVGWLLCYINERKGMPASNRPLGTDHPAQT